MKIVKKYRMLCSVMAIAGALGTMNATAAPGLIYEGGALTGVTGVIVNNRSYNVDFLEGPCSFALRCDNVGFRFKDVGAAVAASTALANQVFAGSMFNPWIPGCDFGEDCWFATPYLLDDGMVQAVGFHNAVNMPDRIELMSFGINQVYSNVTFARWAPEVRDPVPGSPIPEPESITLFSVAMAGFALTRRKR